MTHGHEFIASTLASSLFLNYEYIMAVTPSISTVPLVIKTRLKIHSIFNTC